MAAITINPENMREIGDNVRVGKEGNLLVVVIDTTKPGRLSTPGKMKLVASTKGFTSVPGGLRLNINAGKNVV